MCGLEYRQQPCQECQASFAQLPVEVHVAVGWRGTSTGECDMSAMMAGRTTSIRIGGGSHHGTASRHCTLRSFHTRRAQTSSSRPLIGADPIDLGAQTLGKLYRWLPTFVKRVENNCVLIQVRGGSRG